MAADAVPTPPWRTPPKPAPTRQPLGQGLIVDTALRILDAEGLDAVTMRRVAQELETGPASLYAHVANKDELLELLLERVAGEMEVPAAPDPSRWREQLRDVCRNVRKVLISHRDVAQVSRATIPTGPNALRISEAMLAIMLAGGVDRQRASWALDRLFLYINSDAYEASLFPGKIPPDRDPADYLGEYLGQVRDYMAALPADRFPNTVAMADELMSGDRDERFEFGLELLIGGLAGATALTSPHR